MRELLKSIENHSRHNDESHKDRALIIDLLDETKRLLKHNLELEDANRELVRMLKNKGITPKLKHDFVTEANVHIRKIHDHYKKHLVKQEKRFIQILKSKEEELIKELEEKEKEFQKVLVDKDIEIQEKDMYYPMLMAVEAENFKIEKQRLDDEIKKLKTKNDMLNTEIKELRAAIKEKNSSYNDIMHELKNKIVELEAVFEASNPAHRIINTDKDSKKEIQSMIERALENNESYDKIKESLLNAGYEKAEIDLAIETLE